MTLLRNEAYSDYGNAFKKSVQSQDTNTTLKYHTSLIKDLKEDTITIRQSVNKVEKNLNSIDIDGFNHRLTALEDAIYNNNGTGLNVPNEAPTTINTTLSIVQRSPIIIDTIPDIIAVKSVQQCVEQYLNGWDGIPPLRDWPESWKKGKNRVKYDQRLYIGLLYLKYAIIGKREGREAFYAKFGALSVGEARKA